MNESKGKSIYDCFIKEGNKVYISKKDLEHLIVKGTTYRHFKGNIYMVDSIAFIPIPELNDLNKIPVYAINIIYTALYGNKLTYCRSLMDFIAEVGERADNVTGGKRRFEKFLISDESNVK